MSDGAVGTPAPDAGSLRGRVAIVTGAGSREDAGIGNGRAAAILLAHDAGTHLRVHALDFPESRGIFGEGTMVPINGTMPGNSFKSGKPVIVNRLDPAEMPPEMYAKATAEGLNSFCDVPLISRSRTASSRWARSSAPSAASEPRRLGSYRGLQ